MKTSPFTLAIVPRTKSIDAKMMAHVRERLRDFVENRYGGNVSRAAKAYGISQAHLNDVLNEKRGLGVPVLLQIATVEKCSLDELLGLPGASVQTVRDAYRLLFRVQGIDLDVAESYLEAAHEGGIEALEPEIVLAEVRRKQRDKDLGPRVRVDVRKAPDDLDEIVAETEAHQRKGRRGDGERE